MGKEIRIPSTLSALRETKWSLKDSVDVGQNLVTQSLAQSDPASEQRRHSKTLPCAKQQQGKGYMGAGPAALFQTVSSRVKLRLGLAYVACLEVKVSAQLLFSSLGECVILDRTHLI